MEGEVILAAVQMEPKLLDVEANIQKSAYMIEKAIEQGANVIVLPELANTGYAIPNRSELEKVAEDAKTGRTIKEWEKLAKRNGVFIVGGFAEKDGNKIYNASVLLSPEGVIGTYRKLHLFSKEKMIFDPGNKAPWVYKNEESINIGMMICFDWIFPEVARVLALEGATILAHSANLVLPYAQRAMPIRALENHVFAITANRIGKEGEYKFTGMSIITNYKAEILAKASPDKEEVIVAKVNIKEALDKRITRENDLFKDRRPEFYKKITE